ncbi:MAG: YihY/virulence factor BrkB family protein [Bacteroidales bacterium]
MMIYKKRIKAFLKIAGSASKRWWAKDPFMQSAVIAYYAIFSIPGLLVMIISISNLFFQRDVITGNLYTQIASIMGVETAKQVRDMIISVDITNKSLLATIIGLVVVFAGATGVFVELQKALNIIWEVKAKPRRAILTLVRTRLFSFGLIVSIGFLLLISLIITTILAALSDWVLNHWPNLLLVIFYGLKFIISFGVVMFLFALMFKFLPDAKIQWKHLWLGSVLTALLFLMGKTAIGFYLSKTNPGSAYGAAGSIILILLWVSYSSMIGQDLLNRHKLFENS